MKVHLLSDDVSLFHALEKMQELNLLIVDSLDSQEESDVIIISDRIIHHSVLGDHFKQHTKKVFYLVSNQPDTLLLKQIKTICDSLNVQSIQPRLTTEQIAKAIYESLFPGVEGDSSNVVAILSSISNVGVTSSTLSIAAAIQSMTEAKIGVIGNNAWDDGVDQIYQYKGKFLHEIKTQLTNRMLDPLNFTNIFHKDDKCLFYYLAGNQDSKIERLFTIEEMDYLIRLAKETFDLVLIDAGCHWDNANMIQSLYHADLKLLIMNQQRKAIKKFNQIYVNILQPLGYTKNEFLLVINQYSHDSGLPDAKMIHDELNIPYITSIPDAFHLGVYAEINQQILYHFDEIDYIDSVNQIARGIVSRTKLDVIKEPNSGKKRRWFSLSK